MPRPRLSDAGPLTPAERQRRRRERQKTDGVASLDVAARRLAQVAADLPVSTRWGLAIAAAQRATPAERARIATATRALLNLTSPLHIVPVSGGKDSQVVLDLTIARHGRDNVVAIHQDTRFDHPDTYAHLAWMEGYYGVDLLHVRSGQYDGVPDFIRKAGYFPNSSARGCTSRLKQKPFAAWLESAGLTMPGAAVVHMGMRSDESDARTSKYGGLSPDDEFALSDISSDAYPPTKFGQVAVRLDIVDWTEERVFAHLRATGARINPLYARGHKRVGCFPCILAGIAEWTLAANDPTGQAHITELGAIQYEFQQQGNPRKFVTVHRTQGVMEIVRQLAPAAPAGCALCHI